jgi:septum formation protein
MLFGIPSRYHFILASRSPRRQALLKEAGFIFEIRIMDYVEEFPAGMKGREIAEYLSALKAKAFTREILKPDEVVITADTVVWCNERVLDKPADHNDAVRILRLISANTHEVITGVTLLSREKIHTFSEVTMVTFDKLTEEEIDYYVGNFRPYDKAGAYGIQEWIGLTANSRIEGSYFNVMGLPVHRLIKELQEFVKQKR